MSHISEIVDQALLDEMVAERFVSVTTDPTGLYRIYNYTQRAQYDGVWNDVTTTCRGLILDPAGMVVARPFRKFFNLGQVEALPDGPFVAQDKMDGSLGIIYLGADGLPAVATRGSFTSDQAMWATAWLRDRPAYMDSAWWAISQGVTLLAEIIYPANRIVVDYGTRAELVLLAGIDIMSGEDVRLWEANWPGAIARSYEGLDLAGIEAMQEDNAEGFVLRWPCGTRVKVKFPEYVRLHRLLTGVNARTIWELLANDHALDDLLSVVPDEFYAWVHEVVAGLRKQYDEIESEAQAVLATVHRGAPRKDQAEIITRSPHRGVVFAMLDGKPYASAIWRMIRPEAAKPFRQDEP